MRQGLTVVLALPLVSWALSGASGDESKPGADAPSPAGTLTLPDGHYGTRTAPLLLLTRPDVRADLGLSPKQADDAVRAAADLHARAAATRGLKGAQAVEARRAVDGAQRAWVEANLTPDQLVRLVQLDLQWEGPAALVSRPVVADTLGLTAEQRAALARAVDRDRAARAQPGYAPVEGQAALGRQALAILTPDQKERWRSMLGRRFLPQVAAARAGTTPRR